jgi:hypothetical protein
MSMSLADALTVAEEYRAQFVALEQDLRSLDCPAQYLLAANEAQGPNAPATQAARRVQLPKRQSR